LRFFKLELCTNYSSLSRAAVCPSHGLITLMSRHYLSPIKFALQTKRFLRHDVLCGTDTFVQWITYRVYSHYFVLSSSYYFIYLTFLYSLQDFIVKLCRSMCMFFTQAVGTVTNRVQSIRIESDPIRCCRRSDPLDSIRAAEGKSMQCVKGLPLQRLTEWHVHRLVCTRFS